MSMGRGRLGSFGRLPKLRLGGNTSLGCCGFTAEGSDPEPLFQPFDNLLTSTKRRMTSKTGSLWEQRERRVFKAAESSCLQECDTLRLNLKFKGLITFRWKPN